jgi:hypothetical protein
MDDAETQKAAAHFAMADAAAKGLEDYLRRGRQHESLEQGSLVEMFVASLKDMAAHPGDRARSGRFSDLEAEFGLRGIEPPYDRADGAIDTLAAFAADLLGSLSSERKEAINEAMLETYAEAKRRSQ